MRLKKLILENFGPFKEYAIDFPHDETAAVLLVGKNNEGKSSILRALKILSDSTKVIGKNKYLRSFNETHYYILLKQDVGDIRIGRLIYNYGDDTGKITGHFSDGFEIKAYLDPKKDIIYADYSKRLPSDLNSLFGFIPPLGPIAEHEELITKLTYLKANINTSLAPRHLRNYFYQLFSPEQFQLVQSIIKSSWHNIELHSYDIIRDENLLECFYKEEGILREISWAGQGLQVWFQIITHLVYLINSKILILDEPEVNLHPEKQNDLLNIIKQHFNGSVIIATHSIELMNNTNISHIINIKKSQKTPTLKLATNRIFLEEVRANIGSTFNFIASQFEEVDYLIFTESVDDYKIIKNLLDAAGIRIKDFNIPIHGLQQYRSTIFFKKAYKHFIGEYPKSFLILDRDYYPEEYFLTIQKELIQNNISLTLTPGKEIENLFIFPKLYKPILSTQNYNSFVIWFKYMIDDFKDDVFADYTGQYLKIANKGKENNTLLKEAKEKFDKAWKNIEIRYQLIPGKKALKKIRKYFQDQYSITLTNTYMINLLIEYRDNDKVEFLRNMFKNDQN